MTSENRVRAVLSGGRGRRFKSSHSDQSYQALSDKIQPAQTGKNKNKPAYRVTVLARIGRRVAGLFLAAALAFDPHVLWLAWSAERQETVAATSRATCEAAAIAIREGRWLTDDPPAAMRCERGSAFAPGWDCIQGYSCPRRPQ
jgi:hypothetical protein